MSANPPRPAATIMLVRDGSDGIEVFMVVRHHQIEFASGALVFPGGKVDPHDHHEGIASLSDSFDELSALERAVRAAAIREAYEESGVLLARDNVTGALIAAERLERLGHYRDPLNKGEIGIVDFLRAEGLRLAGDLIVPYVRWIAPEIAPKRFDTYFYIALAPSDHLAAHDGYESVDSVWIRPQDALRERIEGKRIIVFPTRMVLGKLARCRNAADAIALARETPFVTVETRISTREDGEIILHIPAEAGFELTEELLSRA
jgi:8-oxo-dGTP pyrophosphatase MutT (NUDIX family)